MASAEASRRCPYCGDTGVEDDYTHGVSVCTSCGATVGEVAGSAEPLQLQLPSSSFRHHASGEQTGVIRGYLYLSFKTSHLDKTYSAIRQGKLLKEVKKVAAIMKLPASKTQICLDQAKEMCRRQVVGQKGFRIEVLAAVLVYLGWKSEISSVLPHDMVNIGVRPNVLFKATQKLCKDHPDLFGQEEENDEQRLRSRLERIFPCIHGDERRNVISLALELWSMVIGLKVQKNYLHKIAINDYCILAVALQYVRQKNLSESELKKLAENLSMTPKSLKTRIWMIKSALLQLAAICPSLAEDVKRKAIKTQNVHRYIGRLLKNKDYLMCELQEMREDEEMRAIAADKEICQTEQPPKRKKKKKRKSIPLLPKLSQVLNGEFPTREEEEEGKDEAEGGGEEEDEEDENLSDLDDEIEEYILTEKEVELRKKFMSSESEAPTEA